MGINRQFRTCPDTGLVLHRPAETLIKANAVAAVVCLLVGGILAIGVAMTRWPAVHMLPVNTFYQTLTAHGLDMLIFWIIFFEIAVLYFVASSLLRCRLATPRFGWLAFALMVIGAVLTNVAILQGRSSVMMTSYVPLRADPAFYLGLILFAVGALIGCFIFLGTLVIARYEKTYEGSIPLVVFGALTACIIAIFTIASGAIVLVPTFLWSVGLISHIDPLMYRVIWWGMGHSSQQINVATQITIWYAVAAIVFGARPMSERVSRGAFLLYILFLQLASAHHLLVDPGISSTWKFFNTSYFIYLAVLASMIHGLTVPGSIELQQRRNGYTKGLFEWLRKAPWGNPVFSAMFISLIGFGFLGGITGVMMGTEQLNINVHNTLYVPGHFHATVVIGTTLAFMGLTYFLVPVLFRRDLILKGLARWQPYIYGIGMSGAALAMMGAGTLGVPRRDWDITGAGLPFAPHWPGAVYLMLGLLGITAIMAILGGAIFVLIIVGSILFGKRLEAGEITTSPTRLMPAEPVAEALEGYGSAAGTLVTPGTFVLALAFLLTFVVYYFISWKYLGTVWGLH